MRKARKDTGVAGHRKPTATAIPALRTLFDYMDERKMPYYLVDSNENMVRWRNGRRGISAWSLMELADKLGFDIVAVPRPGVVPTPATPSHGDSTPVSEGTAPGTSAPVGLAA